MSTTDPRKQRRLDSEIESVRDALRNLVAQRNSLSSVSKLPVEILATIFRMDQQSELALDDRGINWMRVSHVCRQWRQIALNMPQFWSHINFRHPLWTEEMVKRTQNLGFIINIRSDPALRHSILDWGRKLQFIRRFLRHHMDRIQEINVDVSPVEVLYILQFLFRPFHGEFTKNAPQLQAIRLPDSVLRNIDPIPYLEAFFVRANNLKVLEVSCTRNWGSRLFTNLSRLKVVNPKGFGRPSQDPFLSALERMPQLKTLHLQGEVLPLFPLVTSQEGRRPVLLPQLRFLTVEDSASLIPNFLESIKLDSPFVVSIRHNDPTTDYADVLNTISLLPSTHSSIVRGLRFDLSMTTLMSSLSHNIQLEIETWHRVPSASALENHYGVNPFVGDPFLALGLSWWATIDPMEEAKQTQTVLSHFCDTVPCKNLFVLSLTSSELDSELPEINSSHFRSFLGAQPDLHTVFVSGNILTALLTWLDPRPKKTSPTMAVQHSDNNQEAAMLISFPSLRHLSVSSFDFSEGSLNLFDCLFSRMECGHKLETLTISDCEGLDDGKLIEKLDKVANHLTWDRWQLPRFSF